MRDLTQTFLRGTAPTVHRIDLPCERTDFSVPPCDVHIKFLAPRSLGDNWTLWAHAAAGKPDVLARWLSPHSGIEHVRIGPGIAPKQLSAKATTLPPAWTAVTSFAKVLHLNLGADGHASWFVEGVRDQIWALVKHLDSSQATPSPATEVRCRPVYGSANAPPSRGASTTPSSSQSR